MSHKKEVFRTHLLSVESGNIELLLLLLRLYRKEYVLERRRKLYTSKLAMSNPISRFDTIAELFFKVIIMRVTIVW